MNNNNSSIVLKTCNIPDLDPEIYNKIINNDLIGTDVIVHKGKKDNPRAIPMYSGIVVAINSSNYSIVVKNEFNDFITTEDVFFNNLKSLSINKGKIILNKLMDVFDKKDFFEKDEAVSKVRELDKHLDIKNSLGTVVYELFNHIETSNKEIWVKCFNSQVNKVHQNTDTIKIAWLGVGKFKHMVILDGKIYLYVDFGNDIIKRISILNCVLSLIQKHHKNFSHIKDAADGYDCIIGFDDIVASSYSNHLLVGKVIGVNGNQIDVLPYNIKPKDRKIVTVYNTSSVVIEKAII